MCRARFHTIGDSTDPSFASPVEDADAQRGGDEEASFGCARCGGTDHEESLLICDGCERCWHLWCCRPALAAVPDTAQWFCAECVAGRERARERYWERERARQPQQTNAASSATSQTAAASR
eukprot:3875955-Prymnesium_polylepis.1